MPKILVAGKLHPKGRALLDAVPDFDVCYIDEISEPSYAPYIGDADALLIRTQPMGAQTIVQAERLQIVSRHGVGFDAVDVASLNARNIALAVCGDVNSTSVAEHAAMMILAASKRVLRADKSVRTGPWNWRNTLESQDLRGQNLLLVGYGRIGRHTADMMAGFKMNIRAYDPFLQSMGWPDGDVAPFDDLHDALHWADVTSISVPKGDRPLIGAPEFSAMRDGAILVNTARGGIVDETAMVAALQSGKLGAAGLDVFDTEPFDTTHPLAGFDQVVLSPHIAGVTLGAAERMAIGSAQNIIDHFNGAIDRRLIVNLKDINYAI